MNENPVLEALITLYANQLFDAISAVSGDKPYFYIRYEQQSCRMDVDNPQDVRDLICEFALQPMAMDAYADVVDINPEDDAPLIWHLAECVGITEPTEIGFKRWFSVLEWMGYMLLGEGASQ